MLLLERKVLPRPLLMPEETKLTPTVPLTAPAVAVLPLPRPTVIELLSLEPPAKLVIDPLALALPLPAAEAFKPSVYDPLADVFVIARALVPKISPT